MSASPIYFTATGYELLMRVLYGRHYADRMRIVAEQVPAGASVLELCCGPGTLYQRYLRARASGYIGLDVNPGFVRALRTRGIDAREQDLSDARIALPAGADVVIMQASLYHFLPAAAEIVDRMVAAAHDRVIVSEPIRNLASSDVRLVRFVGRRAADPGVGGHGGRFTERTLDELMARYRDRTLAAFPIPGGREKVYVLAGARTRAATAPGAEAATATGAGSGGANAPTPGAGSGGANAPTPGAGSGGANAPTPGPRPHPDPPPRL